MNMFQVAFTALVAFRATLAQDNYVCANMEPICTDEVLQFVALDTDFDAEDGNVYGCLSTQPDPTWYYFRISDGSPMNSDLYMELTASQDIDFIIYGPFDTLALAQAQCGSLGTGSPSNNIIEDCSYSATNEETPALQGVNPGEYYVMLVTNYAQTEQVVTLRTSTKSTSTAWTDCTMVGSCTKNGLALATPHACQCQSSCSGGFCNTLNFVEDRLGLPLTTDDDALCPDRDAPVCCCSCPNCNPSYTPGDI